MTCGGQTPIGTIGDCKTAERLIIGPVPAGHVPHGLNDHYRRSAVIGRWWTASGSNRTPVTNRQFKASSRRPRSQRPSRNHTRSRRNSPAHAEHALCRLCVCAAVIDLRSAEDWLEPVVDLHEGGLANHYVREQIKCLGDIPSCTCLCRCACSAAMAGKRTCERRRGNRARVGRWCRGAAGQWHECKPGAMHVANQLAGSNSPAEFEREGYERRSPV